MREIAKIGFDGVEYAFNFGGLGPEEVAAFTKETGLECCGAMFHGNKLMDSNDEEWNYALALNPPAISISAMVDFTKQWKEILDMCVAIQKNAEAKGLVFSYHNHWAEYDLADQMADKGLACDRFLYSDKDRMQTSLEKQKASSGVGTFRQLYHFVDKILYQMRTLFSLLKI